MRHQTCEASQQSCVSRDRVGARRVVGQFAQDRGGAVLIEMSIVLLILVTMLIGVTELSQALTLQRRVVSAAASAADLLTRAHRPLGSADLVSLGPVLDEIVGRQNVIDGTNARLFGFRVTVFTVTREETTSDGPQNTNVTVAAAGSYSCNVTGLDEPVVPSEISAEVENLGRIVLVETQFRFTSAFTFFIKDAITLGGTSFFIPRLDSKLALDGNLGCDGKLLPLTPEPTTS